MSLIEENIYFIFHSITGLILILLKENIDHTRIYYHNNFYNIKECIDIRSKIQHSVKTSCKTSNHRINAVLLIVLP